MQPTNNIAGVGEDVVLSVQATGTPPLYYAWVFNGSTLSSATGPTLWLTNLTTAYAGTYYVDVYNSAGAAISSNAVVTVPATNLWRRVGTGRVVQIGTQAGVPITFRANGRENSVSFSLGYNTNTFSNPVFRSASNQTTVTTNLSVPGTIGVALTLPAGAMFPPGYQWLGLVQFDLAAGANALQGGLSFATNPTPIAASGTNGLVLTNSANVQPQFTLLTTAPEFQAQSGLFHDRLLISNPGGIVMTNVDLLAVNLGNDSLTNAIKLFNSQSNLATWPFGDPVLDVPCDCTLPFTNSAPDFATYLACGSDHCSIDDNATNQPLAFAQINNLFPGESREITAEFYVADHATVPQPAYSLYLGDPLPMVPPLGTIQIDVAASRFTNGVFLVEFSTFTNLHYYVQYAGTPNDLITNALTALPPVDGTGNHVQWMDDGPPKTLTPPTTGSRFFRVLQGP